MTTFFMLDKLVKKVESVIYMTIYVYEFGSLIYVLYKLRNKEEIIIICFHDRHIKNE